MIRDILKWVVPGLISVVAGSTLCMAMTTTHIAADVAAQTGATARRAGLDWAELSYDVRDVTLSGTTTDQQYVDAAQQRLALVPGVRSVTAHVTLAPMATPYRLEATLSDGKMALSGGVPDQTTRQLLLARAGLEQGGLELRSGMPERRVWVAGAQFAIDQLRFLDQGESSISDLRVDLKGRAKSERDYRDVLIVLRAGPPAGVTLGDVKITPALVSPYQWRASSDGTRIDVSGYVPDDAMVERYRAADTSGLTVATGLALGSGEPAGFADTSQSLVEQLSRLEYGTASIVDGQSTLTGAPRTLEIAQAVTHAAQSAGSIVVLEPPRIDDYWASATLQDGGAIVFDGYAPDEATRDAFQAHQGADTAWLKLGRGAPERYQSAMEFGLAALDRLSQGRFALRQQELTLSGVARSVDDYKALMAVLSQHAPQGFVLASAEIEAPAAAVYQWSAVKMPSGAIVQSGMVPGPQAQATLTAAAGQGGSATFTYASGEPRNFIASAQTGLELLAWLSEGKIEFDGTGWTVTGSAKSIIDKGAIETDFAARKLAAAGWSMAIAAPAPAIAAASPYLWSASAGPAGVTLAGHVPNPQIKRDLLAHAGAKAIDDSELASGEPAGFAASAKAAIDAVVALGDATAQFDGASWSLSGRAASASARDTVLVALDTAIDTAGWTIKLDAPDPAPAAPYTWSASKAQAGSIIVTGHMPAEARQRLLSLVADATVTDQTSSDLTPPPGFAQDAAAAMQALSGLADGFASFDGAQWRIDGNLQTAGGTTAIKQALADAATPATAWNLTLLEPAPVPVVRPAAPETAAAATPAAPVTPPAVDPAYAFSASRSDDGTVILSGQVPDDAGLQALSAIANGDTAAVSIADGAPPAFLATAELGLRSLMQLKSGQLDFADGAWRLVGTADDTAGRDAVEAAIAADTAADWSVSVEAPAAIPPAAPPAPPPSTEQPKARVDISACAGPIADFSGRNAILFQSGAALIATESDVVLDDLVTELKLCPDAVIHIEGHTDADGDSQLNLGLSVARAEAVVNALIEKGVNPQRLYAVGYGETQPIADNATAEGKRLNRRIVVTVTDEHF